MVRFLQSHAPYKQYVEGAKAGVLELPAYDKVSGNALRFTIFSELLGDRCGDIYFDRIIKVTEETPQSTLNT